jgi:uncharacterized Zn-finger protein
MAGDYDFDDDDSGKEKKKGGKKDFDCPDCNANNPLDEPLADGDEVRCNYCGTEYKALVNAEGRIKFKEL